MFVWVTVGFQIRDVICAQRYFRYRRVSTESRVLVNFGRSFGCRRNYSQSMKEMEYVSREGYLQEELFTELVAPGFLNQTIYVDINFYFSPLSVVASFYYGVLCWNVWGGSHGLVIVDFILRAFLWRSYGFRHATSLVTDTYAELNCIKPS